MQQCVLQRVLQRVQQIVPGASPAGFTCPYMHGAACCSVLQCVAVEVVGKEEDEETAIQNIRMCVAVQCVAMCCSVLRWRRRENRSTRRVGREGGSIKGSVWGFVSVT